MMIMSTHDLVAYENPDMMSLQVLFEYLYNEGVKVPRPHHVKVKWISCGGLVEVHGPSRTTIMSFVLV